MKYNLNLTQDYVSHWGLKEAIRELIANNIDEGGKLTYSMMTTLDGVDKLSEISFVTEKELPIEAFLLGYSVKANENSIGQYGEGLKLAMLVLTRLHKTILFLAGAYEYRFKFEVPDWFGVETLHVERHELGEYIDDEEPITGTKITLFDIEKSALDACYTYAMADTVIPNSQGLYCQGLLVEPNFFVGVKGIRYGFNLNTAIKGNRDRNYFPDKDLVIPVIEKSFKPCDLLEINTSWNEYDIYDGFSDAFAQEIAKFWFLKKHITYAYNDLDGIRILVPDSYWTRYAKREGYLVAPYWSQGSRMNTPKDRQILSELVIGSDYVSEPDPSELTRKERVKKLKEQCLMCKDVYDLVSTLVDYIPIFKFDHDQAKDEMVALTKGLLVKPKRKYITHKKPDKLDNDLHNEIQEKQVLEE